MLALVAYALLVAGLLVVSRPSAFVERRLRHWAGTQGYELLSYEAPGLLGRLHASARWWYWAPWGLWRVIVHDDAGHERVGLVRIHGLRTDPTRVDVQWKWEQHLAVALWRWVALWILLIVASIVLVSLAHR